MSTIIFGFFAGLVGLAALGAAVALLEYVAKALVGHRAEGVVVRLEPDGWPSLDVAVVRFESAGQSVEVRTFSFLVGVVSLRVGNRHPVAYLRDPARAVILDGSEALQRILACLVLTSMTVGFLFAASIS